MLFLPHSVLSCRRGNEQIINLYSWGCTPVVVLNTGYWFRFNRRNKCIKAVFPHLLPVKIIRVVWVLKGKTRWIATFTVNICKYSKLLCWKIKNSSILVLCSRILDGETSRDFITKGNKVCSYFLRGEYCQEVRLQGAGRCQKIKKKAELMLLFLLEDLTDNIQRRRLQMKPMPQKYCCVITDVAELSNSLLITFN